MADSQTGGLCQKVPYEQQCCGNDCCRPDLCEECVGTECVAMPESRADGAYCEFSCQCDSDSCDTFLNECYS